MTESKAIQKMSDEVRAKLKALPREQDYEDVAQLPAWVKIALARMAATGMTQKDAAALSKRSANTLSKYTKSDAAKKWMGAISEVVEDPLTVAQMVMTENAVEVTADRFLIFEAAKHAEDWNLADRIARDLQDRMGLVAKKQDMGKIQVKIQLGGGASLDAPMIEAEWEEVEEES